MKTIYVRRTEFLKTKPKWPGTEAVLTDIVEIEIEPGREGEFTGPRGVAEYAAALEAGQWKDSTFEISEEQPHVVKTTTPSGVQRWIVFEEL